MPIFAGVALLVCALLAGWRLFIWPILKRPILSVPIAIYGGLVAWLGAHDAQALFIYALIALAMWRLVHRHSFQRLVGSCWRSSWRAAWGGDHRRHATMVLIEPLESESTPMGAA
jgi:hypothetical protein